MGIIISGANTSLMFLLDLIPPKCSFVHGSPQAGTPCRPAPRAGLKGGGDTWTKLHFGGDFLDYQIFSLTEINFGTCNFFAAGGNV